MNLETRQQMLSLKYYPTSANNYRNQQPDLQQINSTLMLASRIFREYKQNQQMIRVRKVSAMQPDSGKQKTTTIDTKRFNMYKNSKQVQRQLNSTANNSFYSKKSVEKRQPPKTAISRVRRIIPQVEGPTVSAQSWCVLNGRTGDYVCGFNHYRTRQMASITKIMTCLLSLQLSQELELDIDSTHFIVPQQAERVGGTSAQLQAGDRLNIRDLLYGLMLPSGNDAAVTLQHNFESRIDDFVGLMNDRAQSLGLDQTMYANPHGLFHECNYSSAYDIGKLTYNALKNFQFASIVRAKIYFSQIEDRFGDTKEVFWENTNKMLYQGFKGVKTGITKEAGPCVVEYFEDEDSSFIIVLLNCRSVDQRWQDAQRLLEYVRQ